MVPPLCYGHGHANALGTRKYGKTSDLEGRSKESDTCRKRVEYVVYDAGSKGAPWVEVTGCVVLWQSAHTTRVASQPPLQNWRQSGWKWLWEYVCLRLCWMLLEMSGDRWKGVRAPCEFSHLEIYELSLITSKIRNRTGQNVNNGSIVALPENKQSLDWR